MPQANTYPPSPPSPLPSSCLIPPLRAATLAPWAWAYRYLIPWYAYVLTRSRYQSSITPFGVRPEMQPQKQKNESASYQVQQQQENNRIHIEPHTPDTAVSETKWQITQYRRCSTR